MMQDVILTTDRLILRKMTKADFSALCEHLQDAEVMYAYEHAFSDTEVWEGIDKQFQRYEKDDFGVWAVILKENGKLIGQCGLSVQPCEDRELLEIGYIFQKKYWHKGYATEAAIACREYAFDKLNADEVFSLIRDTNIASQNVALRNGMCICGTFVKHYHGKDMRHYIFSVRKAEMDNNISEVAKIMGVDEETIAILPKIAFADNMLNPWGDELLKVFHLLNLNADKTVLDIPCGGGGVSVRLAKEYGVGIDGYDLLQGFIVKANEYATQQKVNHLCRFSVGDIRNVIKKGKEYDSLLWIAPPHIWDDYRRTVEELRKCVKNNGYIAIADAYLYKNELKNAQPDYETLDETLQAVTAHGDRIIKLIDYKGSLWAGNYLADREAVAKAIESAESPLEKEIFEKYLNQINESESSDTEQFGLYVLVLQINKK